MSRPDPELEKWLTDTERRLELADVSSKRLWQAVPRKPDAFVGPSLTQNPAQLFPDVDGGGNCRTGANDWPMLCAPKRWIVRLHNPQFSNLFAAHPDWPNDYMSAYFDREYILERVPNGTISESGLTNSTQVAVWAADGPDDLSSVPPGSPTDIRFGIYEETPPDNPAAGDLTNAAIAAVMRFTIYYPYRGTEGVVGNVLYEFRSTATFPFIVPVQKQDFDGPAVNRWFYFASRMPIYVISDVFHINYLWDNPGSHLTPYAGALSSGVIAIVAKPLADY